MPVRTIPKLPLFQRSAEAGWILDALLRTQPGEVCTWSTIERAARRPREEIRGQVETAKRHALQDHGAYFSLVRNVGYKRLARDEEISDAQEPRLHRIRRQAKEGIRDLSFVHMEKLATQEDRHAFSVRSMVFAACRAVTKRSTAKKLLAMTAQTQLSIPIDDILSKIQPQKEDPDGQK